MNQYHSHINIPVPGKHQRNILVDVFAPDDSKAHPVIIFSHGFKGFKDWGPFNQVARFFAASGFIFVKFNFSFNGTTSEQLLDFADMEAFGNNNFTKELDDLEIVIDWIHQQSDWLHSDLSKISLLGHSRGGGITILKAAEDSRIASLATWAAVSDFSRFITNQDIKNWKNTGVHYVENTRTGQMMPLFLQLYHDYILNQQRLHIRNAVGRLQIPVLLVHGTSDETVSIDQAIELYTQNPSMIRMIKIEGGDHSFGAAHPFEFENLPPHFTRVVQETASFFQDL